MTLGGPTPGKNFQGVFPIKELQIFHLHFGEVNGVHRFGSSELGYVVTMVMVSPPSGSGDYGTPSKWPNLNFMAEINGGGFWS